LRGHLAGDAFPDGDRFHNVKKLRRQAGLRGEMEELLVGIQEMDRAGFRAEVFERFAQDIFEHGFARGIVAEQRRDFFRKTIHGGGVLPETAL
jgi:hypothetical protein